MEDIFLTCYSTTSCISRRPIP